MTPQGRERLILTPAPTTAAEGRGDEPPDLGAPAAGAAVGRAEEVRRLLEAPLHRQLPDERRQDGLPRRRHPRWKVTTRAGTSYIIYTESGHMMVHLMDKEGRTKYAAAQPTPEEALKAYQSYSGYFGRFVTVRESESAVRHPQPAGHDAAGRVQRSTALLPVHRRRAAARRPADPERRGRAGRRSSVLAEDEDGREISEIGIRASGGPRQFDPRAPRSTREWGALFVIMPSLRRHALPLKVSNA